MVPVNPEFGVPEASYVLNNAQVRGVVCSPEAYSRTVQACATLGSAPWIVANEAGIGGTRIMEDEVAAAPRHVTPSVALGSEARREGKECVSTGMCRCAP